MDPLSVRQQKQQQKEQRKSLYKTVVEHKKIRSWKVILARDIWYFALKLANHGSAWISDIL